MGVNVTCETAESLLLWRVSVGRSCAVLCCAWIRGGAIEVRRQSCAAQGTPAKCESKGVDEITLKVKKDVKRLGTIDRGRQELRSWRGRLWVPWGARRRDSNLAWVDAVATNERIAR